jgi:single-strand DNA-binding protein
VRLDANSASTSAGGLRLIHTVMAINLSAAIPGRQSTVAASSTGRHVLDGGGGRAVTDAAVNGASSTFTERTPHMFETPLTVVGRIVTDPIRRKVGDQEVIKFRVASNARRRNGDGNWEPGNSLFITVNCWGRLVVGVGATLAKGDAVIAVGNVYTSEYEDREGARRSSLEMRATAVGPDLSRQMVRIEKSAYPGPSWDGTPPADAGGGTPGHADVVDPTEDHSVDDSDDAEDAASSVGSNGLTLSV